MGVKTSSRRAGAFRIFVAILKPLMLMWTRKHWVGMENIPAKGGIIIAANHVSNIDPLVVAHYIWDQGRIPRILAKHSLFKIFGLGSLLRATGMIPVYRGTSQAGDALRSAVQAVNAGRCVLIFPEGTATKDPELWPMKGHTGAVRLAHATGAPLIPLAHWGTYDLLPRGKFFPRGIPRKRIDVIAGEAIDVELSQEPTSFEIREATAHLMDVITRLEARLRNEEPPEERFDPRAAARSTSGDDSSSVHSEAD
jgi:1-acyl-sn-glycerol-3-phosphate acyltransferase